MYKRVLSISAAVLLLSSVKGQEQKNDSIKTQILDEVVVSDSRFELKRENSGKTIIKINAEELQHNQGKSLAEIINTKSGIEITGSRGREGTILGVFCTGRKRSSSVGINRWS